MGTAIALLHVASLDSQKVHKLSCRRLIFVKNSCVFNSFDWLDFSCVAALSDAAVAGAGGAAKPLLIGKKRLAPPASSALVRGWTAGMLNGIPGPGARN